ncbi:MAG TPA: glycine zipper 2TM domain-containing protein [Phenylobacterium sp.]
MRKSVIAAALAAFIIPTASPALADPPPWAPAHGKRAHDAPRYDDRDRYDGRVRYDSRGRYVEPRRLAANDTIWRGNDGRYRCRRANGTTGLVIGGAIGALVGRELDGGRNRTVGTLIGAAGGALLGREIDRGNLRCR